MSQFSSSLSRIAILIFLVFSIQICKSQGNPEILTNDNIIKMTKAGLPKSLILAKIKNSNTKFDVSVDAMIELKKDGVDDDVLTAMASKENTDSQSSSSSTIVTANGDLNLGDADPGIYYKDEKTGQPQQIDASIFSQAKSGSGILSTVTYGIAKTRSKAILSGIHANNQLANRVPVFYFVFPKNSGNSMSSGDASDANWYSIATTPNEFMLVKFKVNSKDRQIITGSFSTYTGFTGGIEDENKVPYHYTKIKPGFYKVYFDHPLPPGEFAFLFAGTTATHAGSAPTQKAFDFGIIGVDNDKSDDPRPPHPAPHNPLNIFKKKSTTDTTKSGK